MKKKDLNAASARPAEATGTRGFALTDSYKHEAADTLQRKDSVLKEHEDRSEPRQAYSQRWNAVLRIIWTDRLSQVCDHKDHKAVMAP